MVAVKTADVKQDFKKIADRITRGEKILISRPKNENIVMITEAEYNKLEECKQKIDSEERKKALNLLNELRTEASKSGFMSDDEINAEIKAARAEKKRKINAADYMREMEKELEKARHNIAYLEKLDKSLQQIAEGRVVVKTMEELEELAERAK